MPSTATRRTISRVTGAAARSRSAHGTNRLAWINAARSFTGITADDRSQNVVRVGTVPAGMLLRFGEGSWTRRPIVKQLPVGRPPDIRTLRRQLTEDGTGHELAGWLGGAAASAEDGDSRSGTMSARFRTACFSVVAASVTPGGIVLLQPHVGGVAGFPANCYPPGSRVTVVAKPERGFRLLALEIESEGRTRTADALETTLTVTAPVKVRASFFPEAGF